MSLRRMLFNCRLKTPSTVLIAVLLLTISIGLIYQALESVSTSIFSLPRENRRGFRIQSKMSRADPPSLESGDVFFQTALELEPVHERDLLSAETKEAAANFLAQLFPKKWSTATETDEMALELKHFLSDYGLGGSLGCQDIDRMKIGSPITYSRTKNVDLITKDEGSSADSSYDHNSHSAMRVINTGPPLALKTFSGDSSTKIACMKEIYDPEYCEVMGNYRLLREILLLSALQHPGVINLKGTCLRGNRFATRPHEKGILLITESGTPLTQTMTRTSSWSQQLLMALQVTRLLIYLDKSPVGSLRFSKLDLKDFVLVQNKDVKLADLDDLLLGEQSCTRSSDCEYKGRSFVCVHGKCEGLNSRKNLDLAIINVLSLILSRPPQGPGNAAVDFVNRLTHLQFNSTEAVAEKLKALFKQASLGRSIMVKETNNTRREKINHRKDQVENISDSRPQRYSRKKEEGERADVDFSSGALAQFDRYNRTNFPGIYDYPCAGSRVSWGCFHTVSSLEEVATKCILDPRCKSFITFSTKPESESLMTIVMKNSSDLASSRSSSGTTLFVRQPGYINQENNPLQPWAKNDAGFHNDESFRLNENIHNRPAAIEPEDREGQGRVESVVRDSRVDHANQNLDNEDFLDSMYLQEGSAHSQIIKCLDGVASVMASAHASREKRLMTHLGLKGTKELAWRQSAEHQPFRGFTHLVATSDGMGGQFNVNFSQPVTGEGQAAPKPAARRATFLAAEGPGSYHMAYAVVYHLDRILGIYHTPPCVAREISEDALIEYQDNADWESVFHRLISSDGTLTGILVPPTPKAIKASKMLIKPLETMTHEVITFERQEKLQLEYTLLWWLGRMKKTRHSHLGYKGHLIHFNAEKAFTNTSLDLSGFLNHCQFPNVVFKALNCFRCEDKQGVSSDTHICNLGEMVTLRAAAMFPNELELNFQQLSEDEIAESINSAASSILAHVNKCIKEHDRHTVLY